MLGLRFCAWTSSSCGKWGPLFIAVCGPFTVVASRCGAQAPDAQAQQLWLTGPVAPQHVGSSQTRARTRVPCIGRRTLNHCATREALFLILKIRKLGSGSTCRCAGVAQPLSGQSLTFAYDVLHCSHLIQLAYNCV